MICQITIRLWQIMDAIANEAFYSTFNKIETIKRLRTNDAVTINHSKYEDDCLGLWEAKVIVELLLLNIGSKYVSSLIFYHPDLIGVGFRPVENMEIEEIKEYIDYALKARRSSVAVYFSVY